MVFRKFYCLTFVTQNGACIPSVAAVNNIISNQNHIRCAARLKCKVLASSLVTCKPSLALALTLGESFVYFLQFFFSVCRQKFLVNFQKSVPESGFVVLTLKIFISFQVCHYMFFAKLRNFATPMTVEDSKKMDSWFNIKSGDMRIFIRLTPSLHADGTIF